MRNAACDFVMQEKTDWIEQTAFYRGNTLSSNLRQLCVCHSVVINGVKCFKQVVENSNSEIFIIKKEENIFEEVSQCQTGWMVIPQTEWINRKYVVFINKSLEMVKSNSWKTIRETG